MQPRSLHAALVAVAVSLAPGIGLAGDPAPTAPPKPAAQKPAAPAPSGVGIVFEKATFAEALAKAKAASRPLFVDFFSEG